MTPTLMRELSRLTSQAFAIPADQQRLLAAARSPDVKRVEDMSESAQRLVAALRWRIQARTK